MVLKKTQKGLSTFSAPVLVSTGGLGGITDIVGKITDPITGGSDDGSSSTGADTVDSSSTTDTVTTDTVTTGGDATTDTVTTGGEVTTDTVTTGGMQLQTQ